MSVACIDPIAAAPSIEWTFVLVKREMRFTYNSTSRKVLRFSAVQTAATSLGLFEFVDPYRKQTVEVTACPTDEYMR